MGHDPFFDSSGGDGIGGVGRRGLRGDGSVMIVILVLDFLAGCVVWVIEEARVG